MNNEYRLLYNCPIEDNELMHFGVKGMHWGHRKDPYSGYNAKPRPGSERRKKLVEFGRQASVAPTQQSYEHTMAARKKNRSKKEARYDKKISKATEKGNESLAKVYKAKKKYKLTDFDEGTKLVDAGYKSVLKKKNTWYDYKLASINDKSVKRSEGYKAAKKAYRKVQFWEANHGPAGAALHEIGKL